MRGRGTAAFTSSVDVKKLHKRGFTTRTFHNSWMRARRFETWVGYTCGRVHSYVQLRVAETATNRQRLLSSRQYPGLPLSRSGYNRARKTHGHRLLRLPYKPRHRLYGNRADLTLHNGCSDFFIHVRRIKCFFPSYGVELCDSNDGFLLWLLHTRQRDSRQATHARLCPQERVEMEKHRHILRAQFHYGSMGSAVVCPAKKQFLHHTLVSISAHRKCVTCCQIGPASVEHFKKVFPAHWLEYLNAIAHHT